MALNFSQLFNFSKNYFLTFVQYIVITFIVYPSHGSEPPLLDISTSSGIHMHHVCKVIPALIVVQMTPSFPASCGSASLKMVCYPGRGTICNTPTKLVVSWVTDYSMIGEAQFSQALLYGLACNLLNI